MNPPDAKLIQDRIIEVIRDNQEFLLLTHVNPDGDALGSLVALRRALDGLGKKSCVLFPGDIPPEYRFVVAREEMLRSLSPTKTWDVVFILDTPCESRLPESLSSTVPDSKERINIDHHVGNTTHGTLNWVDPRASSVGEMLFRLFDRAGYAFSAEMATALYTAILTDTGSFRFPNTMSSSLKAGARLVELGADAAAVADRVYACHSLQKYRLLGEALSTLQRCCSGRAAFMWVTREMLRKVGGSLVETEGFVNFPRELEGVEVAILFKQEGDGQKVKVSLRSKKKAVEVERVAALFQGGGHPTAAGCTVSGPMEFVQEQVLKAVASELARADAFASGSAAEETSSKG
jgi:phosphoesterase RecJ-like protein